MRTKLIPMYIYLIILGLIFIGHVEAQVDPEIIVGIWSLDEGNGNEAGDSSENGRDGIIQGASWVDGKIGDALDFKKGDTVVVTLGDGIVTDKVSIVLWLQFTDLADQQNYFSIWDSSSNRYVPYKTSANELHFWCNSADVPSGVFVEKNTWYHVANVNDGQTFRIYVNGELEVSQPVSFSLVDNAQKAWFATDQGGWISACLEDEIGIFNDALTEAEVRAIMEHGIGWALSGAAVEPSGKLSTTWATLRIQD